MGKRSILAANITALALLLSSITAASGGETPLAPEQVTRPSEVAPPGASQGTIKVHGHWTIEVRNPNGTLAERREFENAYAGGDFLPRVLARSLTVLGRLYAVDLRGGAPGAGNPLLLSLPEQNGTLTVDVPTSGPDTGKLVFSGKVVNNGSSLLLITRVDSSITGAGVFTASFLNPGVTIAPGQQVAVTVVVSFS